VKFVCHYRMQDVIPARIESRSTYPLKAHEQLNSGSARQPAQGEGGRW
jgi:hypothetical protein